MMALGFGLQMHLYPRSLQLAMTTTDFICTVVITNSCLKYLQAFTSSLQAEAKDIVTTVNEIDMVTTPLQSVRDNIGTHHSQWFSTVEKMCADVGIRSTNPSKQCSCRHSLRVLLPFHIDPHARSLAI